MWPSTRRSSALFVALSVALHTVVLWHLAATSPQMPDVVATMALSVRLQSAAAPDAVINASAHTPSSMCCRSGARAGQDVQVPREAWTPEAAAAKALDHSTVAARAPLLQQPPSAIPAPEQSVLSMPADDVRNAPQFSTAAASPADSVVSDIGATNVVPDTLAVLHAIHDRVDRLKSYPLLARKRGWEGDVLLGFTIATNGDICNTHVARSSGNAVLDQSALRALNQVHHVPEGLWVNGHTTELHLPVVFQLREG